MRFSDSKHTVISLSGRVLSVLLSLSLVLGTFVFAPVEALAADDYNVSVKITVTNDADGWNSASLKIYTGNQVNGFGTDVLQKEWNIKDNVDDDGENTTWTYNCGKYFPSKVVVYTDFGGGITFRYWEADVKVYVNGTQIKAEHITSNSGAFVSSDDTNTLTIDKSVYPYPASFTATSDNEVPQDLSYEQSETETNQCTGKLFSRVVDQYGVEWCSRGTVTNDTDSCSSYSPVAGGYCNNIVSTTGVDHTSTYQFVYATGNSVYPSKSFTADTTFIFRHQLKVLVNDEAAFTARDFSGKFVDFSVDAPTGYTVSDYFVSSGYGALSDGAGGKKRYTFGAGDGVVTADLSPIKYKIAFDRNGATSGKITTKTATYDKSLQLPSNSFNYPGYHFVGWNTEPDGSGTAFANRDFVQNLTAVSGAIVTLYAQWEENIYEVTYDYPEGINMPTNTQEVPNGGTATPPTIIPESIIIPGEDGEEDEVVLVCQYTDDGGHYALTTTAEELENITSDTTIALSYELVPHNYSTSWISKAVTCTEDGERSYQCEDCGHIKTETIPHAHQAVRVISEVPATCTSAGHTAVTVCDACGETLDAGSEIPAKGHTYYDEAEWSFNDDLTEATATITCKDCGYQVTKKTASRFDITHTDVGTDRIYSATLHFNETDKDYTGTYTYYNLYAEIPYVNENGEEDTIIASRLKPGEQPTGAAVFVEGTLSYTDTLTFKEDTKLILCDGAALDVNISDKACDGLNCWYRDGTGDYSLYYRDLTVYGQKNGTGELNVNINNLWDQNDETHGIYCGAYTQYGGKVNLQVTAPNRTDGNAVYATGDVAVHRGEFTAASNFRPTIKTSQKMIITGGTINITNAGAPTYSAIQANRGIELGLTTAEDSIVCNCYVKEYASADVTVAEGQILADENGNHYSGALTNEQCAQAATSTLRLYKAAPNAKDKYNLTVTENIDINLLVDVAGHLADGEEIEKIVYTYPDVTSQTRKILTETVTDVTADTTGYFAKTITLAVAQAAEPVTATVYFTNGETKELTVSVANYCRYIIDNAEANNYPEKLVDLCYTVLEYGRNAISYFGYQYPSDIAYPEYTLPEKYSAEPSITSQAGISYGSAVTGIYATQMFILSRATLRLTFKDDVSALSVSSATVGGRALQAEIVQISGNKWAADISGIYATELNKPILLELSDGTKVQYAASDWAMSILTYSSNADSKALARSMYYYSAAANAYFE